MLYEVAVNCIRGNVYTCSRIVKHNFTQQPAEVNSVASSQHALQISKTLPRITELPKHFLLLLDISLFKNQPSKLCVEREFWAPALSIKNVLTQFWSHARSDMWLQLQFLNCCQGERDHSRACEQVQSVNGSHSSCGLAQLLASLQCPLPQGVTCLGCRDCNSACSPSAAPGPEPINTGSSCLGQGHAACVGRGILCVTAAPDLQRQSAKDQCFRLKLMTPANNALFIKLILFCWY